MIPPSFGYSAPRTLPEALDLLAKHGDGAKIIAGGHSLLPMMKLRFAEPEHLIDLNHVKELKDIRDEGGLIKIGAMTTERELIDSPLLAQKVPLLPEAARLIADPQVRYRGTIGGDLAHGDPGNDHPAIAIALDAVFILVGKKGQRSVAAKDFFVGTYTTQMQPDEILSSIHVKPFGPRTGAAYCKLKRKTGDFATAASAVVLTMAGETVSAARIALTNVGATAIDAKESAAALVGKPLTEASIQAAVNAAKAVCQPAEDLRGNSAYKVAMAGEMTRRAIRLAASRCH